MMCGSETAVVETQAADASVEVANTVAPLNTHLRFVDTKAHGYSLLYVDSTEKTSLQGPFNSGTPPYPIGN